MRKCSAMTIISEMIKQIGVSFKATTNHLFLIFWLHFIASLWKRSFPLSSHQRKLTFTLEINCKSLTISRASSCVPYTCIKKCSMLLVCFVNQVFSLQSFPCLKLEYCVTITCQSHLKFNCVPWINTKDLCHASQAMQILIFVVICLQLAS